MCAERVRAVQISSTLCSVTVQKRTSTTLSRHWSTVMGWEAGKQRCNRIVDN